MSETWVTKQLLPDLQAVCTVTFSGEKSCFYNFLMWIMAVCARYEACCYRLLANKNNQLKDTVHY